RPAVIEVVDHDLRNSNPRHSRKPGGTAFDLLNVRVGDFNRHESLRKQHLAVLWHIPPGGVQESFLAAVNPSSGALLLRGGKKGTQLVFSLPAGSATPYPRRMARRPRQAPGGFVYHVLNRGVARLPLFEKPADYDASLRVLAEALQETPMRILAFV